MRAAARSALRRLAQTPPARLVPAAAVDWNRRRISGTSASRLVEVMRALDDADVPFVLGGGWGLDVLLGRQTRRHSDVDVILFDEPAVTQRAVRRLTELGYEVLQEDAPGGARMPTAIVLRDSAGRTVDLLPVKEVFASTVRSFAGQEVRCLAPSAQLELHVGYEQRGRDRVDIDTLCRRFGLAPPAGHRPAIRTALQQKAAASFAFRRRESSLVIPVPAADEVVDAFRPPGETGDGLPAHATVLYPFLPSAATDRETVDALADLASSTPAFAFTLHEVGRFPDAVYLAPEPAEPFTALTATVEARWPQYPPYAGAFDAIVPHVTVVEGRAADNVDPALIARRLPVEATATELWLVQRRGRNPWTVERRFPLADAGSTPRRAR